MKTLGNLIEYLRANYGITKCAKINGPNGAFISYIKSDGTVETIPVGKKSQQGELKDYHSDRPKIRKHKGKQSFPKASEASVTRYQRLPE